MKKFDWLESPEFHKEIERQVTRNVNRYGMATYDREIIKRLIQYLGETQERVILEGIDAKLLKYRTKKNALRSLDVLMEEACAIAKRRGRRYLTVNDFNTAYKRKFCRIWPFC